jgi:hypothetical protein
MQQLSLSSGVAIGAAVIEATRRWSHGGVIEAADFAPAFLVVAAISAASALVFLRLPANAGDEIANHIAAKPTAEKLDPA